MFCLTEMPESSPMDDSLNDITDVAPCRKRRHRHLQQLETQAKRAALDQRQRSRYHHSHPKIYTYPPSNYTFYCGRSARYAPKLLEACYLTLHMIPINPCDCCNKNVSDNSGCLTLWCPLSLHACSQSGRQKRVSQNPLPLYGNHWSFASTLYFSSGGPPGCFSLQDFLLINRKMCIISSPPLPVPQWLPQLYNKNPMNGLDLN